VQGVSERAKGPKATQKEIEHTSHQHAYQAGRVRAGKRAQSNLKRNRAHFQEHDIFKNALV